MNDPSQQAVACPVGESTCEVIDEVHRLRRELAEVSELVHTDTLTGLNNYRFLIPALEQELERTRRTGYSTGFIMIDLDHFKRINDQWGHDSGNLALQHAAKLLRASVRRMDVPCRFGGEEFAVILPSSDLSSCIQVAERIRHTLEAHPLTLPKTELTLTASLGVALYSAVSAGGVEALIKSADKFLYDAKEKGRNRVCHAPLKPDLASVSEEEKGALFDIFSDSD